MALDRAPDSRDKAGSTAFPDLPAADIVAAPRGWAWLAGSYMWVLTLFCLVVAIGLVWWSRPAQGVQITIRFPQGHGLKQEDSVRFRGIEIGTVQRVSLNPDLTSVDVVVDLQPFADPVAREGSRFWIVRPELSLLEVSGLETAVGHKYIGVLPGAPDARPQTLFDGMPDAPPDLSGREGTEIILRSQKRHGVQPGSPLLFRGVIVGRVLSVDLSRDSRRVDTRVRIFQPHQDLVTSHTRFWASSGIDVDLGWGAGLRIDVESLETVVSGGISMLTVRPGGQPLRPGQQFELFASPEDEWYEQANDVAMTESENLRGALPLSATWKKSGLFGSSDQQQTFVGTHLQILEGSERIVVPADILAIPPNAVANSFRVQVANAESISWSPTAIPDDSATPTMRSLMLARPLPMPSRPFRRAEIRIPTGPEAALAIRREQLEGGAVFFHLPLTAAELGDDWSLSNFDGDGDVWHGAPLIAEADGRLIGFLNVQQRSATVTPVTDELLEAWSAPALESSSEIPPDAGREADQ